MKTPPGLAMILTAAAIMIAICSTAQAQLRMDKVPFVGCSTDGRSGLVSAPEATTFTPMVESGLAKDLAYYTSVDIGVLAPRGWYCLGTYGPSGGSILVTPDKITFDELRSNKLEFSGPAVELSIYGGDTPERFVVAEMISRLFPRQMNFVENMIKSGDLLRSEVKIGKYPTDRIVQRSDTDIEYTTPANRRGLGTMSSLTPSDLPILGLVVLSNDMDIAHLSFRLPPHLQNAAPVLLLHTRREMKRLLN